jgi:hypothetical protein
MSNDVKNEYWKLYEDARATHREDLKASLEREKMALEREKFSLENHKLAVSLHVEDFKARWQELLNFDNENNRFITLYVTALLVVISWILSNSEKYEGLSGLYGKGDNAYFIMSIAIINAIYTFSIAIKGYQIQQIAQYQHDFLAGKIWDEIKVPFIEWERYRRTKFAEATGPEPVRKIYYVLISILPVIVSYAILLLYVIYEWKIQADRNHFKSFRNWFCIISFLFVTLSLVAASKTASLNATWLKILNNTKHRVEDQRHL